jgi:hypothetical protein
MTWWPSGPTPTQRTVRTTPGQYRRRFAVPA